MKGIIWSDRECSILAKLWADGITTAVIAQALQRSKNAVCGMARRVGLEQRGHHGGWACSRKRLKGGVIARPPSPPPRAGLVTLPPLQPSPDVPPWLPPKVAALPPTVPRVIPPIVAAVIPPIDPPDLTRIGEAQCLFLAGAEKPYRRCEAPALPGSSYCAAHDRICYIRGKSHG